MSQPFNKPTMAQSAPGFKYKKLRHAEFENAVDVSYDAGYLSGWNDALEHVVSSFERDFEKSFGKDTLAGFCIYMKGQKR